MSDKLKVYLSGAIASDPNYQEKFGEAERLVAGVGMVPLNPAVLPSGMKQSDYMRINFSMLDSATIVLFLDDWQSSPGARLEHAYAEYIGKPSMTVAEFIRRYVVAPSER